MKPNPYPWLAADTGVLAQLGTPPRIYPSGEAPQGVVTPYATWQTISGVPENYLSGRPDLDNSRVQFDCWGTDDASADATATVIRNALEPYGYQVSLNHDGREPETKLYRLSFDFSFWLAH